MDTSFWYYGALTGAAILLFWGLSLPKYNTRGWPNNLNMWEYAIHSLIPYIIWTLTAILFLWGAYRADLLVTGNTELIYRILYAALLVFSILAILLFFWAKSLWWTLIFAILTAIVGIILLGMFSQIDVINAWLGFPYILMVMYFIYIIWYAIWMN